MKIIFNFASSIHINNNKHARVLDFELGTNLVLNTFHNFQTLFHQYILAIHIVKNYNFAPTTHLNDRDVYPQSWAAYISVAMMDMAIVSLESAEPAGWAAVMTITGREMATSASLILVYEELQNRITR